jgi:capsular polysaccharide biosynthesis protein
LILAEHEQGSEERQDTISLRALAQTIWRGKWLVVLVVVSCVGFTSGVGLMQTPLYVASTDILIKQEQEDSTPGNLGNDVEGLQKMTRTVAKAIDSRPIAEAVIQRLDLQMTSEDLLEALKVEQIPETQFVRVSYESSSPQRGQEIADAFGDVFSEQASVVSPGSSDVSAVVWERATVPEEPVRPNLTVNIGLALVVGLVLGIGLVLALEYLNKTRVDRAK